MHRKSDFIDVYRALFRLTTTKLSMLGVCTQQKSSLFYITHIREQVGNSLLLHECRLIPADSEIVIWSYFRLHFSEKLFIDIKCFTYNSTFLR